MEGNGGESLKHWRKKWPLRLISLVGGAFLLSCGQKREATVPPGVDPLEVAHLAEKVTYNAAIRPLFWQFRQEKGPLRQLALQHEKAPLKASALQELLQSEQGVLATQTPEVRTLLWRWAQQGAIREQPWLVSPLPLPQASLGKRSERSEVLTLERMGQLSAFFFSELLGPIESGSPARQKGKELFLREPSYRTILQRLAEAWEAPPHDLRRLPRALFPPQREGLWHLSARLFGLPKAAFSEDFLSHYERALRVLPSQEVLLSGADLEQYNRLLDQDEQLEARRVLASRSALAMEDWLAQDPAFVPLRRAKHYTGYEKNEAGALKWQGAYAKGRTGRGAKLTPQETRLTAQDTPFQSSSFAFWMHPVEGRPVSLRFGGPEEWTLTIRGRVVEVSQKGHPRPFLFRSRVGWLDPHGWNSVILTLCRRNYQQPAALYINGIEVFWPLEQQCGPALLEATEVLVSGAGVLDDFCFYSGVMTALEQAQFRDDRSASRAFSAQSEALLQHCNTLYNPSYQTLCQQQIEQAKRLRALAKKGLIGPRFPRLEWPESGLVGLRGDWQATPLRFGREGAAAEGIESLFTSQQERVARMTVHWVSEALLGAPLFDASFPGQRLPARWAQVDRLASQLIAHNWDLSLLAAALLEAP